MSAENTTIQKKSRANGTAINKYCSVAATLFGSGTTIKSETFVHP